MYAWSTKETDRLDLNKRIDATEHQGKEGVCPSCNNLVVSKFVNGIWQWVHKTRCKRLRDVSTGEGRAANAASVARAPERAVDVVVVDAHGVVAGMEEA